MGVERVLRATLVAIAICGLTAGILARVADRPDLASLLRQRLDFHPGRATAREEIGCLRVNVLRTMVVRQEHK